MNALDWLAESLTDMADDVEALGMGEKTVKLKRALLRAFEEACAASRELRTDGQQPSKVGRARRPSGRLSKGLAA